MQKIPHKNLLLDIGGTLVSINESFEEYTRRAIANIFPFFKSSSNHNKSVFIDDVLAIRNSIRAKAHESLVEFSFEYFIKKVAFDLDLELLSSIEQIEKEYIKAELEITSLNDGVLDFLQKAKAKGKRIIIATNNFSASHVNELLDLFSMRTYINDVFISGEMGVRKPSAAFIDTICERLVLNKVDCIIFGDKLSMDIKAANNSGIESVFFNPEGKIDVKQNIPFTFEFSSFNQIQL